MGSTAGYLEGLQEFLAKINELCYLACGTRATRTGATGLDRGPGCCRKNACAGPVVLVEASIPRNTALPLPSTGICPYTIQPSSPGSCGEGITPSDT